MHCDRCKIEAPAPDSKAFNEGWALPQRCGVLCPTCYGVLQLIRKDVKEHEAGLMRGFWNQKTIDECMGK